VVDGNLHNLLFLSSKTGLRVDPRWVHQSFNPTNLHQSFNPTNLHPAMMTMAGWEKQRAVR